MLYIIYFSFIQKTKTIAYYINNCKKIEMMIDLLSRNKFNLNKLLLNINFKKYRPIRGSNPWP